MKTFLFCLLFTVTCMLTAATTPMFESATVYEQLCELNKYWQNQTELKKSLQQKVYFSDYEDLIQLHLQLVEQHLQQKNTRHLSTSQKVNRKQTLEVLREYWQTKQFPQNTRHTAITPYFIDDFNTACAVGHLMRESGAVKEAHWIAETMNNAYIEEMPVTELEKWADKMGFELEELKWIQPGYGIFAWETIENTECNTSNGNILMNIASNWGCVESNDTYAWYEYTGESIKRVGRQKDLENAPSGFYRFQINMVFTGGDYYGCSPMRFVSINDADGPKIEAEVLHPESGVTNGSIELNIIGGVPPYTIAWYDFNQKYLGNQLRMENLQGYQFIFMSQPLDLTHRVEVVDANGCQAFQSFYLYDDGSEVYPEPRFIAHIENTLEGQGTGQISIEAHYPLSYQWSHNPDLTSNKARGLALGDYTVTITDPETQEVYVRQFTILEEEFTDIVGRTVGELRIYPTLANQQVRIDLPPTAENYSIEVFDSNGRMMTNQIITIGEQSHSLEVSDYPRGMYFISTQNETGKFVGRFVKQ